MKKSFENGSSDSNLLEQIDSLDFSQLYDNISEIYDFFDTQISEIGNIDTVKQLLKSEFDGSIIYSDKFVTMFIDELTIKDGKIWSSFKMKTDYKSASNFGEYYLKGYLGRIDKNHPVLFHFFTTNFNVGDIKEEIKKRLYLIKQFEEFKKLGYDFFPVGIQSSFENRYLYKKISFKNSKVFPKVTVGDGEIHISISNFSMSLLQSRENNLLDKKIQIVIALLRKKMEVWIKESKENYKIDGTANYFTIENVQKSIKIILESGTLYMGIWDIDSKSAEEYYKQISEYIDEIGDILNEKRKVAKIVNSCKESLYRTLSGNKQNSLLKYQNFQEIIKEYKQLEEQGELLYSHKVIDLLEDMILYFFEDKAGSKTYNYIKENYNNILDSIVDENESDFIAYYKQKLNNWEYSGDMDLEKFKKLFIKLKKFEEEDLLDIDISNYNIGNMSVRHIQIIVDIMGKTKPKFVTYLYAQIIKYDSTYDVDIDLKKYKNIHNYSRYLSTYEKAVFERIIARAIVQYIESNPSYINDIDKLIEDYELSNYILDISTFKNNYLDKIYQKNYEYRILDDKKLIGKHNINYSLYYSLPEDSIDDFVSNIIVPDIVYKLHMEDDGELIDKCISSLQEGGLTESMLYLGYDNAICNLLSSIDTKDYCNNILRYWYLISDKQRLLDYTLNGLEFFLQENYNVKSLAETDKIDFLMEDERKALEFLSVNMSFPTEIGVELAKHSSIEVRKKLAINSGLDKDEAKALFCGEKEQETEVVLAFLEAHFSTGFPNSVGACLAKYQSLDVKKMLISLPISEEEKEAFCYLEQDEEILLLLIDKYGNTSYNVDMFMARHPSVKVRRRLALLGNKLNIEIQEVLAVDVEEVVLNLLQIGSDNEIDMLMTKHSSIEVRKELATYGSKLNIEVQKVLAVDVEEVVLNLLQSGLSDETDMLIARHPSIRVRRKLATFGSRLNIEVQKVLAEDEEQVVLILLKLGLSSETDMLIARHPSTRVRKKLATFGERLDDGIIEILKQDEDEEVSFMIRHKTS